MKQAPKSMTPKKVAMIVFWGFMVYVGLAATIALARSTPSIDLSDLKKLNVENPALSSGAESFAHNFAFQYFTWSPDRQSAEDRKKRLDPYLAAAVDRQAGLLINDLVSTSKLSKSQVWSKREISDNQAELTLRVQYITTVGKNAVTQLKYFVVPVVAKDNNFLVYDIPRFVKPPESITFATEDTNLLTAESDRDLVRDVGIFLESFFKIYATGTHEEIRYFSRTEIDGLQSELTFTKLGDFSVHATDSKKPNNIYTVTAKVTFVAADQTKFTYPYKLRIQKEADRWFVLELKN